MRLHHLSITAFGPFAQTQEVDFDDLSASGLFLIHGPTGAGKSSILDAVCFALYAAVPGSRAGAKASLVSDHASEGAVPEVTLEFTASGRRFRVVRSPEFERAKKRGAGTTSVPARVVLNELTTAGVVGPEWVPQGSRLDETALVIKDVVGMGLEQFNKVVLLPQGEFAAFLRAKDEERRGVLQRLFDTQRFSDIEAWFAERRRHGVEQVRVARADLATALLRVDDVLAGLEAGGDLNSPIWAEVPVAEMGLMLDHLLRSIDARAGTALAVLERVRTRLTQTDEALIQGRQNAQRQHLAATAAERIRVLDDAGHHYDETAARVRKAERAAATAGHLASDDAATAAAEAAHSSMAIRHDAVAGLFIGNALHDRGATVVPGLVNEVQAVVAQVSAHTDSLITLGTLSQQGAAFAEESSRHKTLAAAHLGDEAMLAASMVTTRSNLAESVESRDAKRLLVADLPTRLSQHKTWSRVQEVQIALAQSGARLDLLQTRVDVAALVHLETRESLVDLRERRLAGMAAELALPLTEGAPCPVCGSPVHPLMARSDDTVTVEDIALADSAQSQASDDICGARSGLASEQASHAAHTLELAAQDIDLTADEVRAAVDHALAGIAAARTAAEALPVVEQAVELLSAELERLQQTLTSSATARAHELALGESKEAKATSFSSDAEVLLAEHTATCPCQPGEQAAKESTIHHRRVLTELDALVVALSEQSRCVEAALASHNRLAKSLADNEFCSADEARSAMLPADQVADLTRLLRATEQERAEATALSQQPEVIEAAAQPPPNLEALSKAQLEATAHHNAAHRRHTLCEQARHELRSRAVSVKSAVAALGPSEQEAQLVERLADSVSGAGPDNARRLRLSAFVLGARLAEVAAFANERLVVMSDGRYALVHHDGKGSHGARGGLGLRVSDSWTGQTRDTASLSGGESFMASLALALGLGDAVRAEAGGFDLQTLFVDEGFGSLDEDSLEQVMSVLDALREGGRSVGIVSHVAELRHRIPSQLLVEKGRSGSTIRRQVNAGA